MVTFDNGGSCYWSDSHCPCCGYGSVSSTIYTDSNGPIQWVKMFEDIPWKLAFFAWLHKIFPFRFDDVDKKPGEIVGIRKRYNRKMLFSKSGYLPDKIRGIRK